MGDTRPMYGNGMESGLLGERIVPERWKLLRESGHAQPFLEEVRAIAREALHSDIQALRFQAFSQFASSGSRQDYEALYFGRRRVLSALAISVLVDDQADALPVLEDHLWAWCEAFTWCLPAHLNVEDPRTVPEAVEVDLFAAEMAHTFSELLYLLGDKLHPWIRERIRSEIERRVLQPFLQRTYWWETARMNWSSVCAGSIGMTAMLLNPDDTMTQQLLNRTLQAMDYFLQGYGEDGGCPEGIHYWEYGFGYFVYFAEMLRAYTAGKRDLLLEGGEKLRAIAAFPGKIELAEQCFVNYSDSEDRYRLHAGLSSKLASRLKGLSVPLSVSLSFHKDPCYRWAHLIRDLLWSEPELASKPKPRSSSGYAYLEQLQWLVDRVSKHGCPIAFSAKGGHNGEPHNHNDLGQFLLCVGSESLIADLGRAVYSKAYFGPGRYDMLPASSEGHSVPLINGHAQREGEAYASKVLNVERHEGGALFGLDLTAAYPKEAGLVRFTRLFEWSSGGAGEHAVLELRDEFEFEPSEGEAALEERFISLIEPELADGTVMWRGQEGTVRLVYDSAQCGAELQEIACHDLDPAFPTLVYRTALKIKAASKAMVKLRFIVTVKACSSN